MIPNDTLGFIGALRKVGTVVLLTLNVSIAQEHSSKSEAALPSNSWGILNQVYEAQRVATSYRM
jgi:hypothetical protein